MPGDIHEHECQQASMPCDAFIGVQLKAQLCPTELNSNSHRQLHPAAIKHIVHSSVHTPHCFNMPRHMQCAALAARQIIFHSVCKHHASISTLLPDHLIAASVPLQAKHGWQMAGAEVGLTSLHEPGVGSVRRGQPPAICCHAFCGPDGAVWAGIPAVCHDPHRVQHLARGQVHLGGLCQHCHHSRRYTALPPDRFILSVLGATWSSELCFLMAMLLLRVRSQLGVSQPQSVAVGLALLSASP